MLSRLSFNYILSISVRIILITIFPRIDRLSLRKLYKHTPDFPIQGMANNKVDAHVHTPYDPLHRSYRHGTLPTYSFIFVSSEVAAGPRISGATLDCANEKRYYFLC